MTEPAGPQLVSTSSHRWRATVFFGLAALVWTIWLGAIVSFFSDHELYVFLWCGSAVALWFLLLGPSNRMGVLIVCHCIGETTRSSGSSPREWQDGRNDDDYEERVTR